MHINTEFKQSPDAGTHIVKFRGDTLTFSLALPQSRNGSAWIRTNLGQAKRSRNEIIREVEYHETRLGRDWFDIPMQRRDEKSFSISLPLVEVGHFEAKCFFVEENENDPIWPPGKNVCINIDTADACCANTIYNAFVRQFGPNKAGGLPTAPDVAEHIRKLDQSDFTVIPPSGTFRDLIAELDFIIGHLGCKILMLLPIHPTPTTYGRMGRFGSPYAALSFTAVDPALAVFDPHATPLEQFIELIDAVHLRNGRILIDIAINHTGWAAGLHETHPNWLVRDPQGRIEVPGAWGVRWEDLTKLDYSQKDLWSYMAEVFITWCRRGVDGFRCDAGYMIPQSAWKYIIARVRDQYPDTVFLLEGLGGKISVTRDLLNTANLNWAYSELFQNYDRRQIEHYLPEAIDISARDGICVHFAETHDNPRLAAHSREYARMRTTLCALFSQQGGFGFANGVEWFAAEKINVHDAPSLNWGCEPNQVEHIRRLNHLLKNHCAFHAETELSMLQEESGNYIVLMRHHRPSAKKLLIIVNLDDQNPTRASWNPAATGIDGLAFSDLLSGAEISVEPSAPHCTVQLEPAQVLCLSPEPADLKLLEDRPGLSFALPDRIEHQRLRAKALEIYTCFKGYQDLGNFDPDEAIEQLKADPKGFCTALSDNADAPRVVTWLWPRDTRREVMLPPGHFLLIKADKSFGARILDENRAVGAEYSLPSADGSHFTLFCPLPTPKARKLYGIEIRVFTTDGCRHDESKLVGLPESEDVCLQQVFQRPEFLHNNLLYLSTNQRGGMLRATASWGALGSRYDALLAANMSPDHPEERWIMLTRCRAWLEYQGYSQELNTNCLEAFGVDNAATGFWQYHIPTGQGENVRVTLKMKMLAGKNALRMDVMRHPSEPHTNMLADSRAIHLILRPDIEHRNFHTTTKAYTGPEHDWPVSVKVAPNGFGFQPDGSHHLHMRISDGTFVQEPEWQYMVHRHRDAERGMDPDSDLFSPGYFSARLNGGQNLAIRAEISMGPETTGHELDGTVETPATADLSNDSKYKPVDVLEKSLLDFVVSRDELKTIIAGYPWFLDWGRDALIVTRGLIAAGQLETARDVLKQFARFEKQGTIPNMIIGQDAGNRDTSDAPLWLMTGCADLIRAEGNYDFLDTHLGNRTVRDVLVSIGQSFVNGTPNGIRVDSDSGLVFSPVHFTWMDTDHPPGTPREGYPIEIQALWYAALRLLSQIDTRPEHEDWIQMAELVKTSMAQYFWRQELGYLADCLHTHSGCGAGAAVADDALRPNQLLAITLGAIEDKHMVTKILEACEELLVPGAIRSLADRPVQHPIEIIHNNKRLNDPHHPYQGTYAGDEDTRRKPAYHNGTAWTWLFPSYCEAWAMVYGAAGAKTALAWLTSSVRLMEHGCIGHIPEILDGNSPHTPRGCDAQAWGASELLRVWCKLT